MLISFVLVGQIIFSSAFGKGEYMHAVVIEDATTTIYRRGLSSHSQRIITFMYSSTIERMGTIFYHVIVTHNGRFGSAFRNGN